jgi:hypothetical protein
VTQQYWVLRLNPETRYVDLQIDGTSLHDKSPLQKVLIEGRESPVTNIDAIVKRFPKRKLEQRRTRLKHLSDKAARKVYFTNHEIESIDILSADIVAKYESYLKHRNLVLSQHEKAKKEFDERQRELRRFKALAMSDGVTID